ncbi:MAG: pyridoxamine 5'-phosphate oxidase family protein [Oscillospiraceae bacterium]|jgi:uncharacterized pyridoxamine 5'-phosphate oxidase family protein|nr:pyridoxamine 5'-phosphate oxidase family protein [Oscillospiraceae bacterium]
MNRITAFLEQNPAGFMATVEDGKPRVRPWQFMLRYADMLVFCTGKNKAVYRQLMKEPYMAFSSVSPDMRWIRLQGGVTFTDDIVIKRKVFETHAALKNLYRDAADPLFTLITMSRGEAFFGDFSGAPYSRIVF